MHQSSDNLEKVESPKRKEEREMEEYWLLQEKWSSFDVLASNGGFGQSSKPNSIAPSPNLDGIEQSLLPSYKKAANSLFTSIASERSQSLAKNNITLD